MSKQQKKHDDKTKTVVSLEEYLSLEDPTDYEVGESTKETQSDFQTLLNKAVKATKVDEKGNLVFPDGMSEEAKAAVRAEKKFRDLQRTFQMNQQELQAEKAKVTELEKLIPNEEGLSAEEAEELEQLKLTDPDKWYTKKREYEDRATQSRSSKVTEAKETAAKQAKQLSAEEQFEATLAEINSQRETPITPEMLENDISIRLVNKRGKMAPDEWLSEVADFLDSPKKVANNNPDNVRNLGTAGDHEGGGNKEYDTDILYSEEVI